MTRKPPKRSSSKHTRAPRLTAQKIAQDLKDPHLTKDARERLHQHLFHLQQQEQQNDTGVV